MRKKRQTGKAYTTFSVCDETKRILRCTHAYSGICENIVGSDPALAERLILKTKLLSWLLTRVQAKSQDENRSYAAELLAILLQESRANRLEFSKQDGVETLLKVASVSVLIESCARGCADSRL